MYKKILFTIASIIFSMTSLISQTNINADINADSFKVNETIELLVSVENNSGLHGAYFDINYDSDIFQFLDVENSILSDGYPEDGELLYANNVNNSKGSHVILSYSLKGSGVEIMNNGLLAKIRFRVLKQDVNPDKMFKFDFFENGVVNGKGELLTDVSWKGSRFFKIKSKYQGTFINIESPYYYQSFKKGDNNITNDKDTNELFCNVTTTFSKGEYVAKIYNSNYSTAKISTIVNNEYLSDIPVKVDSGFNTIIAELYSKDNNLDPIATSSTIMYLAPDNEYVKIISPSNHAFINADMAVIEVESPYSNITVNHIPTKLISSKDKINKFQANVWLKKGFNKIKAEASVGSVTYCDNIELYYRKNSEHFNLVLPSANESFRKEMNLKVRGEIGSQYKSDENTIGSVKNIVTIDVTYRPDDYTEQARKIVDNMVASISPVNSSNSTSGANYQFLNSELINLENLRNGTIQVDVYKNREGNIWDDKITRICYLNNNPLSIELTQPNVFSEDNLDTITKIDGFNGKQGITKVSDTIDINNKGALYISTSELMGELDSIDGIVDIEAAPDGTMYALRNTSRSLIILKKKPQDLLWSRVADRSGLFGYDIEYTDKGLFVGASNLFSNSDDGLYLLENETLKNIVLPGVLPHIQFLNYNGNNLYIYGNYYSNLYSFNVFNIEEENQSLKVEGLNEISFKNNENIKQFILSDDIDTAIIRDELDNIEFYKRGESGYSRINIPPLAGNDKITGKYIVSGEYSKGDYITYLVLKDSGSEVIMNNKRNGKFSRFNIDLNQILNVTPTSLHVNFQDDFFHFIYSDSNNNYKYTKGQIFFNQIYDKEEMDLKQLVIAGKTDLNNLFKYGDSFYFNFGQKESMNSHNDPLATFYYKYDVEGTCNFNYSNEDIDGITGFKFEVEPEWINNGVSPVNFGFSVKDKDNNVVSDYLSNTIPLNDFIEISNRDKDSKFKVSSYYDANIERYVIGVSFDTIQADNKFLNFDIKLTPSGNNSPEIYNLAVNKKIPVMVAINKSKVEIIELPISGYIGDKTVKRVFIQNNPVQIERDGSFYYKYLVKSVQNHLTIKLHCTNGAGEKVETEFRINIVDSKNKVDNIGFYSSAGSETPMDHTSGDLLLNTDSIFVTGDFYGLEGAIIGYKTYTTDVNNPTLLNSGLFAIDDSKAQSDIYQSLQLENPGAGYKAGSFTKERIPLEPGEQLVVIYCENPDGTVNEFNIDGNRPLINYNMSPDSQTIEFNNGESVTENAFNMNISRSVPIQIYESGENPNYTFEREYTISGQVKTLYNTNLIVKSFNQGVLFSNGLNQITIPLEPGNKFTVPVTVTMDNSIEKDFYIGFIPDSPLLTNIKRGIRIHASKSFKNTGFIPDFTAINESNISSVSELPKIPVLLKFNRDDIPLPNYTKATFTLNYEKTITGWIINDPDNQGFYTIVDESNNRVYIEGLKAGINRLSWILQFKDPLNNSYETMSSSSYQKAGMEDYFFYYSGFKKAEKTVVTFSESLEDSIYGTNALTLPSITITRDNSSTVKIIVNSHELDISSLWTDSATGKELKNYVLPTNYFVQGRNELIIENSEPFQSVKEEPFTFIYDDEKPKVEIESYSYSNNKDTLTDVSFYVTEANYKDAKLFLNGTTHPDQPELEILGADRYRLMWSNLTNVTNSVVNPVFVKVFDLTDKEDTSNNIPVLNKEIPNTDSIREQYIDLPTFTSPKTIPNETGYQPFPKHTKNAPSTYLPKNDVTTEIEDDGNVLIENFNAKKILREEPWIYHSPNAEVSNELLAVQVKRARTVNNNTSSWPDVEIYKKNVNNWTLEHTILNDSHTSEFGSEIKINNNQIIVGDWKENNHIGAVYVYSYIDGGWNETQKLFIPEPGRFIRNFGRGISTESNKLAITANQKVFVYTRIGNQWMNPVSIDVGDGFNKVDLNSQYLAVGKSGNIMGRRKDDGFIKIYELVNESWIYKQQIVLTSIKDSLNGYFFDSRKFSLSDNCLALHGNTNSIYIYKIQNNNWTLKKLISTPSNKYAWNFPLSIDTGENELVIGSYFQNEYKGTPFSQLYYYNLKNNNFNLIDEIKNPEGQSHRLMGGRISVSNNFTASADNNGYNVYVFGNKGIDSRLIRNIANNRYQIYKFSKVDGFNYDSNFKDSIKLEVYGLKQKLEDMSVSELTETPLSITNSPGNEYYKYIETNNNYYYIIDTQTVGTKFLDTINLFPKEAEPGYLIMDRGSLRIKYDDTKLEGKRPVEIYFTGEASTAFDDLRFYDSAYEGAGNTSALEHDPGVFSVTRPDTLDPNADGTTLYFWLRAEEEGIGKASYDEFYSDAYKRVLKLPNLHVGYNKNSIEIYKDSSINPIATGNVGVPSDWNLLTLKVNNKDNKLSLYINGALSAESALNQTEIDALLAKNAVYDYSAEAGTGAGFYSITNAAYIDKLLTEKQIERLYVVNNNIDTNERLYRFSVNEFGTEDAELRVIGENTDHINYEQNVDFNEANGHGSLKASEERSNLFDIGNDGPGKNYVKLKKSSSGTMIGGVIDPSVNSFTIIPDGVNGRYYFGDRKSSNSGLKTDYWYTVSGNVIDIAPGAEAKLVLRIDNVEQSIDLDKGHFRLTYQNPALKKPQNMNIYIETTGVITLSNDLIFNEGNYILETDIKKSAVSTKNIFDTKGTVNFWYKPLCVNSKGNTSYTVTLFDSEYFTIGAESINGSDAKYFTSVKRDTGTYEKFQTDNKIIYGWQFIQLSYDYEKGVMYFYHNGKMLKAIENLTIDDFGLISDVVPVDDNIFIGTDKTGTNFAEGYIDDLYIGRYFTESKYTEEKNKHNFFNTKYDENSNEIELLVNTDAQTAISTGSLTYVIENIKGEIVTKGSNTFPLDMSILGGGRYIIKTKAIINGHEYISQEAFNIDKTPKFTLHEQTPIIFKDNKTDLMYKFSYDRSFQYDTGERVFAGVAAEITYNGTETKTYYLVQDFYNNIISDWIIGEDTGSAITWSGVGADKGGNIPLNISDVISETDIQAKFKYFYFDAEYFNNSNSFDSIDSKIIESTISVATINTQIISIDGIEYRIDLDLGATGNGGELTQELLDNIEIICTVNKVGSSATVETPLNRLNKSGKLSLYYDDILNKINGKPDYGNYNCLIKLNYFGITILSKDIAEELIWKEITQEAEVNKEVGVLEIDEFSLLYMNKEPGSEDSRGSFVLKYYSKALDGPLNAEIEFVDDKDNVISSYKHENLNKIFNNNTKVFEDVPIPVGKFKVLLTLRSDDYVKSTYISIINQTGAPEIHLTNSVDSKISYNNVLFSWKGYYNKQFNSEIKYQYQIDNRGWSEPNSEWRSVRFFNLKEGFHTFEVKSLYNDKESNIAFKTFFVDIKKPQFNEDKISILEFRNSENVLTSVKIIGNPGAITDASLRDLYINGNKALFNKDDGSFVSEKITIDKDGINKILVTAYDSVGNFTDYIEEVDNSITQIDFPLINREVKYSPLTIVGRINDEITADMEIFLLDPFSSESDDFSGWKKAKINEDRTFFVEDVMINSGADNNKIISTLKLAVRFKTGEVFYKDFNVSASEIVMPIEMNLSTNAAEGENEDTYVEIKCRANVQNISSWSIDYNGDGIYDEIDLVDNPESEESMEHFWSHKYSSIDQFFPRVRIITVDGNFFSVSDSIIIHEKIKDASPNLIQNPVSVSSVKTELETHKVFVLREENSDSIIDVYFIPKYDAYLLNTGEKISLKAFDIENATLVKALSEDNLFVVSNKDGVGTVYQLKANSFGNFVKESSARMSGDISDLTFDKNTVYISFKENNKFVKIDMVNGVLNPDSLIENNIETKYTNPIGENSHLTSDVEGLIISDFKNHRILRLNNELGLQEQFGSLGNQGGEFIRPSNISAFGDRILVYDETRRDIQVFDSEFNEQCTLKYNPADGYHNYVDETFFNDIASLDIIAKEEGDRLYYYALILSRSKGQLSMLRLPQYQELRARVRNNRVVFIKDGEVFTSKPDGSDMLRVLSSDSIPKIEGTLDYPALSPDGRKLVFTSRVKLYNSGYQGAPVQGNPYDYDNLYTVNIETQELKKVDLGAINNYSIERPVFNSNGDKIIFSAKKPGEKWQIWVYSIKETTLEKLFTSDENVRFPYYSPDDRYVVFTTDYDGDEDIEIVDTQNLSMRTAVTDNFARDSLPVWSVVYPEEISNPDYKVESKISFVSEKDFHKGVYIVYLSKPDESDLRIFNIKNKQDGGDIEKATVEITKETVEGDYPCFTGDGKNLFFEYFDGSSMNLKKFSFTDVHNNREFLKENPDFIYEDVEVLHGARRPSGMKNTITNFSVENINGDELKLKWDRYTKTDIFYNVQFMEYAEGGGYNLIEKKVSSQTGTSLKGLKIGVRYKVRVCIIENGKEVTTSQWKLVKIPDVIARPSFEISDTNPYVVDFKAWAPQDNNSKGWNYTWIIDNTPYNAGQSQNLSFEFATSGTKIIQLRVEGSSNNGPKDAISEPFEVKIVSDIVPIITKTVSDDFKSIILDASGSLGEKINRSSATWTITGTGVGSEPQSLRGMTKEFDISGYSKRVYVTLTLERIAVNGQNGTDIIEKTEVVELNIPDVVPVINTTVSESNERVIIFDGSQSLGNINWANAQWSIMANGLLLHQMNSASSFSYMFAETNSDTIYSVSLSVPRKSDGKSVTVSKIVSVDAAPIEPVIEYKVIENGFADGTISTAKVVLDCTKSLGNNIDYSQAKWTIPTAANYGDQPTQYGPTAVFSLNNIGKGVVLEVNLALSHKGGTDFKTKTQLISINKDEIPVSELFVNQHPVTDTSDGQVVKMDVYNSTGGNINWESTSWSVDIPGQGVVNFRGPSVNIPVKSLSEESVLTYSCTLYRHNGISQSKDGKIRLKAQAIEPKIVFNQISSTEDRYFEMNILNTKGSNIDWERTEWYIYDGTGTPVIKRGASVTHYFPEVQEKMGYPVYVKMYHKGYTYPFDAYKSLSIEGSVIEPVITYEVSLDDPNNISFSAESSVGRNIKWNNTKWSFGDSSQPVYGATVDHKFPAKSEGKTYRVTMTLSRVMFNGTNEETFSVTRDIKIGADKIKAVVKASVVDGFLVLSASQSEGQGLLLDRSVWLFPGEGDSSSISDHIEEGTIKRAQNNFNTNMHANYSSGVDNRGGASSVSFPNGVVITNPTKFFVTKDVGSGINSSNNFSSDMISPDENYINRNDSFSSQNIHTGAVCRRSIGNEKRITVALTVYRMTADGGSEAETVFVKIDLDKARTSASGSGVVYGR